MSKKAMKLRTTNLNKKNAKEKGKEIELHKENENKDNTDENNRDTEQNVK